jgi:four helix bundle protein
MATAHTPTVTIADSLRERTFQFATRIVLLAERLSQDWHAREVGRQLLKAGTSVAANYRAACRGRSRREFIAKLGVAVEEADETVFWLELIQVTGLHQESDLRALRMEAQELLAILARSHRTARENTRTSE